MIDHALAYAARGWPVFQLAPGSKIPLAGSRGFKDATTDPEQIAEWWTEQPDCNIGLATGYVADVIDVDDWDQAIEAIHGAWESAGEPGGFLSDVGAHGPAVVTPSGGAHLYVAVSGLKNSAKRIPGVDIRGAGGYTVLPPSTDERGAWEWVAGYGPGTRLPTLPGWFVQRVAAPERRLRLAVPGGRHSAMPTAPRCISAHGSAYGRRALEDEVAQVAGASPGQRNDTLNRAAYSLGQLVAGGELDLVEVADALWDAAMAAGLDQREADRTIRSGITRGQLKPRRAS